MGIYFLMSKEERQKATADEEMLTKMEATKTTFAGGVAYRQFWGEITGGQWDFYTPASSIGVTNNTKVFCSAWEYKAIGPNVVPVIGDADVVVQNVAPNDNALGVRVYLGREIFLGIDILVTT